MKRRPQIHVSHYLLLAVVLASLLTALVPTSVAKADSVVYFYDANLEAAIREAIGKPSGDIYESDLVGLTSLYAEGSNIQDLSGLEHCTGLAYLRLGYNHIHDLSPLAGLTSLTELDLGTNSIVDVSALADLGSLTVLNLDGNRIGAISTLAGLTSLTELDLGYNQIGDISALGGLTSLTALGLSTNLITGISALSGLTSLTELDLGYNEIEDISSLIGLTNLTDLNIVANQIDSISPLAGMTSLTRLIIWGNKISDISPLAGMTSLTQLSIGNKISDISPLAGLVDLTWLSLGQNQISDISPLAGLSELRRLSINDNQISDVLPLAGLTGVTDLWLQNNQIVDISPLTGMTGLTYLGLTNNQVSDIEPLVDNTGLASGDIVDLTFNPLDSISANTWIPALEGRGVLVYWEPPNRPPDQPSNLSPADGESGISVTPTLQSSSFSDPDAVDTHLCTEREITLVAGDYADPVFHSWNYDADLTSIVVPSGMLNYPTTYYWHVRYEDNHGAWSDWSAETSFTTAPTAPLVITASASSITVNAARLNGNLTSLGSADNVTVSFMWGTSSGALTNETTGHAMTGTGAFYFDLGGLTPGATYYYKSKAVGDGAGYGAEVSFTTLPPTPLVSTSDASIVTTNAARLNGSLTSLGTADNVTVSFMWGTSSGYLSNETTGQTMTSTGAFYFDLASLIPGTTYYYKAKAAGDGTSYGTESSFTTTKTPPAVTSSDASAVTTNSGKLNGDLTSLGSASGVAVSFLWGTRSGSYPDETTDQVMNSAGTFYFDLASLAPGTTYYYKAKAVGHGTVFGVEKSFTTGTTASSVTTDDASSVTTNSAKLNGNLTSLGTAGSVTVSFVWGIAPGSYSGETIGQAMASTGTFYYDLGSLAPGTTYYFKAKAVGHGDPAYGDEKSFTTGRNPEVESLDPAEGRRKQRLTVTITGDGFDGATKVTFGSGITVEEFNVVGGTEVTADIVIGSDAVKGARDVSVTTGYGTATKAGGFSVVGGKGGICSGGVYAVPGGPSEMMTVVTTLGLLFGMGYLILRRRAPARSERQAAG